MSGVVEVKPPFAQRVRMALGRCAFCWRAGSFHCEMTGQDANGVEVSRLHLEICDAHVEQGVAALGSVPHQASAHFDDGSSVSWDSEGGAR